MATAKAHAPSPAKAEKAPAPAGAPGAAAERATVNPVWSLLATQVQAKLTVSAPDDPYEREAEAVADRVMRMPDLSAESGNQPSSSLYSARALSVQRRCSTCDDEEQELVVQRKCASCEDEERARTGRVTAGAAVQRALASPGRPLEPSHRDYFEQRFGTDFGRVRIHTDSPAAEAAASLNARAFTVGGDIAFARAQYAPGSTSGRHLLAHELTHVAQQGHAPAIRTGGGSVVARAARTPEVQRSPGDDPDLLEQLEEEIAAANEDANQDDDLLKRAHGSRVAFLYKYIRHPTLTSQQVLDDFIDRIETEAKNELDTLTDPANPFTAEFALEKIPKGFPLTWAFRVRFALSMGVDFPTLVKEWQEAYDKLKMAAVTLGDDIFAHGLPIPLDDPDRLQNFKLRIEDSKAPGSNAVGTYARESVAYIKLRWLSALVMSWEKCVESFGDAVRDGDVVVDPAAYKEWVENRQAKFLELPGRARARLAMTEEEVKKLETDAVSLDTAATAIGMASAFLSLFGIVKGWQEASELFDAALRSADRQVAATGGGMRVLKAMKWAWDNDYYSGAAAEWAQNLIDHGPEVLGEVALIVVLGMIPGVDIAVAVYLALTMARDVLNMIDELGAALNDCTNATTVAQLQLASMRLARILTNGAIFILIVLVTEGIGKAAARLRKEAAGLRAADKTLSEEAATKKAMEKLSKEERAALEEGTAKLARKFEQEIGAACSLGSIICRAKLPDHIEKEAGAYPTEMGVPKPGGPYSVQKAALSGVERGTQLLRDEVLKDPSLWTADFRKALAAAKKKGLEWPEGWEVHHVKPVFMGGGNTPENLLPLPKGVHQKYTNWWNAVHRAFKKRFTDVEWEKIYKKSTKDVAGSKVPKTPVQ